MAVYTKLDKKQIEKIIEDYNLGKLTEYQGITKGIMNTNYLLKTTNGKYILRILEGKRDLKFEKEELKFLSFLNDNDIPCPNVLRNKKGEDYFFVENKMSAIFSFLEGKEVETITEKILYEFGEMLAKMHNLSKNKILIRNEKIELNYLLNELLVDEKKLKGILKENYEIIMNKINKVKTMDMEKLPKGIIHNDIFPDNVFSKNGEISGIIDFNDAMTDVFIHDIAIVLNFWIYNNFGEYKKIYVNAFLEGYQSVRKLEKIEKENLNLSLDRAGLTFLFLRIFKFNFSKIENEEREFKDYRDLLPLVLSKKDIKIL